MTKHTHLYGIHVIKTMLKSHLNQISTFYIAQSKKKDLSELHEIAVKQGVPVVTVSLRELDQIVGKGVVHQGVAIKCHEMPSLNEIDLDDLLAPHENPVLLVLDQIQDPHNLGACIRTANAMGACAVIITKDRSVGVTPVVTKVSTGATSVTPVIAVTNLSRTLKHLQSLGFWSVGLVADSECDLPLRDVDMTGPIAVVMGSEGNGLRRLTKQHCDFLATIPMFGSVQSLNVSVATGMALYEVTRQRSFTLEAE